MTQKKKINVIVVIGFFKYKLLLEIRHACNYNQLILNRFFSLKIKKKNFFLENDVA